MARRVVWLALLAVMGFPAGVRAAAAPQAGYYTGYMYRALSGGYALPESAVEPAFFNVSGEGVISDVGGTLTGTVAGNGTITWKTPNPWNFTAGTINGAVLASSGAAAAGGVTTTYRVAATNDGGVLGFGTNLASGLVWRNKQPVGGKYYGAAFGNGQFVAVGEGGAAAISADGTNWMAAATPVGGRLIDVARGTSAWVAIGDGTNAISSPNGIDWTLRPINATGDIKGVAFGGGKFVAVSATGQIFNSADGVTWSLVLTDVNAFWNFVDFANGIFIAGTVDGKLRTSADGTSWNSTVNTGGGVLFGAAFGAAKYVVAGSAQVVTFINANVSGATGSSPGFTCSSGPLFANGRFIVGDATSSLVQSSADAVTWSRSSGFAPAGAAPRALAFGNGVAVAVADVIQSSVDIIAWRMQSTYVGGLEYRNVNVNGTQFLQPVAPYNDLIPSALGFVRVGDVGRIENGASVATLQPRVSPTTNHLRSSIYTGSVLLTVGDRGTILASSNGVDWFARKSGILADLRSLARSGTTNVAVGGAGAILRSTNGVDWFLMHSAVTNQLNRVAFAAGQFVAVGEGGTILTSPNGIAWTVRNSGVSARLVGVCPFLGKLLVIGEDSTVLRSADGGVTWSAGHLGAAFKVNGLNAWDNGSAAGVIRGAGENSMQITSTDGTNWTFVAESGPVYYAVAHGNGRFVAVGGTSRAWSLDGRRWQATAFGSPTTYGVTFGKGLFVAVGTASQATGARLQTSVDGVVWTDRAIPTSTDLNAVTIGNGLFVAVGEGGVILTSQDGITWVDRSPGGADKLKAVTYANGLYVAIGQNQSRSSQDGVNWLIGNGVTATCNSIAYGNGVFATVGEGGLIRNSPSGVDWAPTPSGTTRALHSVRFLNGRFVALGEGGTVLSSLNATNWFVERSNISANLRGMTVANGSAVVVGDVGTILQTGVADGLSPVVAQGPVSQAVDAGQTVNLAVAATGAPPLRYQWFKNGSPLANGGKIGGATATTLSLTGVSTNDAGDYAVVVSNDAGSRASAAARVEIRTPLQFVLQPANANKNAGEGAWFSAVVEGGGPISYRWYRNGVALNDGGGISGALTSALKVDPVQTGFAGVYYLAVDGAAGSATSQNAALAVPGVGQTFEEWKTGMGFNIGVNDGPLDDPDGDGAGNIVEFATGTLPNDPVSKPVAQGGTVNFNGQNYAAVTYQRNRLASGVVIDVRVAGAVDFGGPMPFTHHSITDLGGGLEQVVLRGSANVTAAPTVFFNLVVQTVP